MSYLRHVRTTAEIRQNIHDLIDPELKCLNVTKIKIVRNKRRYLPTLWSDIPRENYKNWKKYRKYQFRN